jgi:hypothetical protein
MDFRPKVSGLVCRYQCRDRYKLTPLRDCDRFEISIFFSNWVDGLNPNPAIYKENKANDWLVWLNVGYIYYFYSFYT